MSLNWSHRYFDKNNNDAYTDWLDAHRNNFPGRGANHVVPAIWFGRQGFIHEFESIFFPPSADGSDEGVELPPYFSDIFFEGGGAVRDEEVVTTHFPLAEWEELLRRENSPVRNKLVEQVIVGRAIPADAVKHVGAETVELGYADPDIPPGKSPVIIGVIDEGLAFANERFKNGATNSRVEFAWMQGGGSVPVGVPGFRMGYELTKWDRTFKGAHVPGIDTLLKRSLTGELIDEDLFYTLAGVANFGRSHHKAAAWRVSHGTHVMDLAAGYDMGPGNAHRHIISVQLPPSVVADTSGLSLDSALIQAVVYIFNRAKFITERYRYNKTPPVVINFSSGIRAGPHDGSSNIEQYLDRLINAQRRVAGSPTQMVLPAGNSFQARSHATFSFNKRSVPPGQKIDKVNWQVPPDDRTHSYIELWLPRGLNPKESKKVAVSVSAPGDARFSGALVADPDPLNLLEASVALTDDDNRNSLVCKAYYQEMPVPHAGGGGNSSAKTRGRFLIALVPTLHHETQATLAGAGSWTISVSYEGSKELEIHGWIHWDDAPISYSRFGRQSFFEGPHYEKFASDGELQVEDDERSAMRRSGTINAIATGDEVQVVGGYRISDAQAVSYSSAEFRGRKKRNHYMAPSETSNTNLGLLAAGSRSGSTVALNGTSVAAPQVARAIAEFMVDKKSDLQIENSLKQDARKHDVILDKRGRDRNPPGYRAPSMERKGDGRMLLANSRRRSNALRGEFGD